MSEVVRSVEQEPQFAAFVGIDWADQKHVWCLQATGSQRRESGELEHTPEAVEAWVAQLCQRFAQRPIAVAVEQSRGALVFMLSKYELLHLFPAPSQMAANLRQALPKLKVPGETLNCPAAVPEPASAMVKFGFEASETTEMLPLVDPAEVRAKATPKVKSDRSSAWHYACPAVGFLPLHAPAHAPDT